MTQEQRKSIIESVITVCVDASKSTAEEFPKWSRPLARILTLCFMVFASMVFAPVGLALSIIRKRNIEPFFKLRTELETKCYSSSRKEALTELRRVRKILANKDGRLFFRGVHIPPYGKFKYHGYTKVLWLLYHWELQAANLQEASDICDLVIEESAPEENSGREPSSFWYEWILNKARVIRKKDGVTATQEYLLKFVDPKNKECPVARYLSELRKE